MNEISRIRTSAPPATRMAPREIDQVRAALRSPVAIETSRIISEIRHCRYMAKNEWVAEAERVIFSQRLVALVAKAESIIASAEYEELIRVLKSAAQPATASRIKGEIAGLIACFPTQADVSVFTAFAIEEVANGYDGTFGPSVYALAAGCRELRRTKTFRPAIAEILNAVFDEELRLRGYAQLTQLPRIAQEHAP
jgi:hypothetical protein